VTLVMFALKGLHSGHWKVRRNRPGMRAKRYNPRQFRSWTPTGLSFWQSHRQSTSGPP